MNKRKLVPYFPSGVSIKNRSVYDATLDVSLPMNSTAKVMLTEIDGKQDMEKIINNLNTKFNIDENTLFHDVASLFGSLNQNYMLNWKYETGNKFKDALLHFFSQYKIGYKERFNIGDFDFFSIFLKMLLVVIRKIVLFWTIVMILCIVAYSFIQSDFILSLAYYFSISYIGIITSFSLHETLHAYMQRKMTSKYPGFIASDLLSLRLVRPVIMPYQKKMIWITVLGPLIPGIFGVLGIILTQLLGVSGSLAYTLNIIFITFALHILYLLPFVGDGKSIVEQLMLNKLGG
ncbi:Coenzyme PQQ synthesis protein D (PqqD) [Bacillus sp. 491mf]|uniref:PqqD family protein n=1 Tax=Bacillus TaxID=1386 RepID=UPI000557773F|nr:MULTISPECIES: PqqD family protein [unclassified Bacillus (in: firmicutes)]SFD27019.1 Coenzyme PQQ synthesis protein D (PqqD) [Bacillus sp. 491mf]